MAPKRPDLSPTAERAIARWQRETRRAIDAEAQARADLADAHRRAIATLLAQGLSVTYIAELLGLTRQWVARMLKGVPRGGEVGA